MARKNLLVGVISPIKIADRQMSSSVEFSQEGRPEALSVASETAFAGQKADSAARADYARRGASRSMLLSIDEMAESAKRMMAGETIVSLDTALIEQSFVSDRLGEDSAAYLRLREAIRDHGQMTPVLLRPHPEQTGRYMVVFGHRRVRVARDLGQPVRAVVKNMADIAHIVAQGQENAARANLTFIEKALFAKKLLAMEQTKATIKAALNVDDTLLSRLLAVADGVPTEVLDALGAARNVGRDRWEALKKRLSHPAARALAQDIVGGPDFLQLPEEERFAALCAKLAQAKPRPRRAQKSGIWRAEDQSVSAIFQTSGKKFRLELTAQQASGFGDYLAHHLDAFYRAYQQDPGKNQAKFGKGD